MQVQVHLNEPFYLPGSVVRGTISLSPSPTESSQSPSSSSNSAPSKQIVISWLAVQLYGCRHVGAQWAGSHVSVPESSTRSFTRPLLLPHLTAPPADFEFPSLPVASHLFASVPALLLHQTPISPPFSHQRVHFEVALPKNNLLSSYRGRSLRVWYTLVTVLKLDSQAPLTCKTSVRVLVPRAPSPTASSLTLSRCPSRSAHSRSVSSLSAADAEHSAQQPATPLRGGRPTAIFLPRSHSSAAVLRRNLVNGANSISGAGPLRSHNAGIHSRIPSWSPAAVRHQHLISAAQLQSPGNLGESELSWQQRLFRPGRK